jgi:hypothetical protein
VVGRTGSSKGKTVVYLGAARAKRKAADYLWTCKKQKTACAHIIHPVGHHLAPPPPVRTTPRPLVVTLDSAAAARAAKSLKALDGEAQSHKAILQLAGAAASHSLSQQQQQQHLSSASSSTAAFLPAPPTAAGSVSGGSSGSSGAPLPLGPTRKSSSAAAAAVAAEQSRREEEAARAASVVTPAMEAALRRAEGRVAGAGYPGMGELLRFLLHAQIRVLDHGALLGSVHAALAACPHLRKAFCDFEAVMACGDASQLVYGKAPAAVFTELRGDAAAAVEVYDEHIFLRLFMLFVNARLHSVREMLLAGVGEQEGAEEEVALVDGLLKAWVARAYDYI